MEFILEPYNHGVKDNELLRDLKRVAKKLGKNTLTRDSYEAYGNFSHATFKSRFGGWNKALELAGLKVTQPKNLTAQQLFDNLEVIWLKRKRQPYPSDMKTGDSKYSITPYCRVFGSWRKALVCFASYINNGRVIDLKAAKRKRVKTKRRKSKFINKRLRYKVIERDGYKCRACGRSPVTDSGVKLHIDHIIPWSKGGETVSANLQTLCSECNIGKGNLIN